MNLLAESDTVELVEHSLVEACTDAVGLWALGLGARVIDVLDRQVEFVFVPLGIAAIFTAAVGQYPQQLNVEAFEQWKHTIVEQIRRRDRRLAIVELGADHLGLGVDEGLLIDPPHALQVA